MVIGIQNRILNGQSAGFFKKKPVPFKKNPVRIIRDFDLYSNDHFGSRRFGIGLYVYIVILYSLLRSGWGFENFHVL